MDGHLLNIACLVKAGKKLKTISVQDEIKLAKFYQSKMQKLCKELTRAFGFKPKVQGTALTFFKRFYLSCSMLDHDPKKIMLTCIYLACKVCVELHICKCYLPAVFLDQTLYECGPAMMQKFVAWQALLISVGLSA